MPEPHYAIPYSARWPFQAFHERTERWSVLVVHRRGGKTVAGINDLIRGALTCTRTSPRFAYLAPYRQQAKLVAWDYLKQFTAPIPDRQISESELHVKLPRDGRVTLYGADNYDALRGIYLDGAVVDEPADMAPEVWTDLLRPALSDRLGWCVWIGTPKGRNAFFRLYDKAVSDPEYYTMILPASQSGILPQSELDSALKAMGKESYEREFECSFNAAIPGSIYGSELAALRAQRRITDMPHDPLSPMFTFWDLGQSDYTCIWLVQFVGRDVLVLNYHSGTGTTPAHYAEVTLVWEREYGKRVATHYLPHDSTTKDRKGRTWMDDLKEAGLRDLRSVPRCPDVWVGINHLRGLMPRMFFHKTNCSKVFGEGEFAQPSGLDCIEYYHKREETQSGLISVKPFHDEFSHGADALRTLAEADINHMLDVGSSEMAVYRHHQVMANRTPPERGVMRRHNVLANRR